MAKRTDPENLLEKILRTKIYEHTYWKWKGAYVRPHRRAETLVDKAMELDHPGGCRNPTLFICLLVKMLQIQPEMDIVVVELIKNQRRLQMDS